MENSQKRFDLFLFLLLIAVMLVFVSGPLVGTDFAAILAVSEWFDPIFFQYNLALALVAISIVPTVVYFYVVNMRPKKERRLLKELSEMESEKYAVEIEVRLKQEIRFSSYFGSLTVMMVVLALGTFIILLLKPTFGAGEAAAGVDYARGANILLLGPFIELYRTESGRVYHHIIVGLTAFQYGFLGAYIWFVSDLVRSFFTLDLTPSTLVDSTVRLITGSVLSLVLSFILPTLPFFENAQNDDLFLRSLPVIAFFIGFFPNRGLLLIQKYSARITGMSGDRYNAKSLSTLSGMSHDHEIRLQREGFDNIENLCHARPIDLALRTGFGYRQLKHWIGQAWLRVHLGEDYATFERETGITSREELEDYFASAGEAAADRLTKGLPVPLPGKLAAISVLLSKA